MVVWRLHWERCGSKNAKETLFYEGFYLELYGFFFKLRSEVSCASFSFTVGYFAPWTVEISRYLIEVAVKLKKLYFNKVAYQLEGWYPWTNQSDIISLKHKIYLSYNETSSKVTIKSPSTSSRAGVGNVASGVEVWPRFRNRFNKIVNCLMQSGQSPPQSVIQHR